MFCTLYGHHNLLRITVPQLDPPSLPLLRIFRFVLLFGVTRTSRICWRKMFVGGCPDRVIRSVFHCNSFTVYWPPPSPRTVSNYDIHMDPGQPHLFSPLLLRAEQTSIVIIIIIIIIIQYAHYLYI